MPSAFTTELMYKPVAGKFRGGRQVYVVTAPFLYHIGYEKSESHITVDAGFETDFASVPRLADNLFGLNPMGKHTKAAVIHDALYSSPNLAATLSSEIFRFKRAPLIIFKADIGKRLKKVSPRLTADLIMLEASGVLGVNVFIRIIHFIAVRVRGGKKFKQSARPFERDPSLSI